MRSKTKNSKAFQLIQAMSKEEKRYFKLLVQGIGRKDSSHLRIFNFLCKQKEYDKKSIKKALPEIKSLGNTERYLYQLLLKSLRLYRSNSTVEITIVDKLKDIQILYDRQLYDLAQAELSEVKQLIKMYDKLVYLPQIHEWKIKLQIAKGRFLTLDFEAFKKECSSDTNKTQNYLQYMSAAMEVALLSRKSSGKKEIQERLDEIMSQTWLQEINHCQSFSARLIFLELQSIYHSTHHIEKSLAACATIVKEIQNKEPEVQEHRHLLYSVMIANAAYFSIYTKAWEDAQNYLVLLQELPDHYITPRIRMIEYYVHLTLNLSKGSVDSIQELIDKGEDFLTEYSSKIPFAEIAVWKYYVAFSFFIRGVYNDALKYAEELIHSDVDNGLNYASRILKLITLVELGNYDILDSSLRSNYRFFKKHTDSDSFELILISFLKQLYKFPIGDTRYKETAIQVQKQIQNYYNQHPFWHAYLPYCFGYLAWLDSKIMNISFVAALKKRAENS